MLTPAQKADVRRWMGYPAIGTVPNVVNPVTNPNLITQFLEDRLNTLAPEEEDVLTITYLAPLATLETAILGAQDNLDTKVAGPWTANPLEISQRTGLFNKWRRDMCAFLGFNPGPGLGGGGIQMVRC